MWKVWLAFAGHRSVLLCASLLAIQFQLYQKDSARDRILAPKVLFQHFFARVSKTREFEQARRLREVPLLKVFQESKSPFQWLIRSLPSSQTLPVEWTVLIISNLFCLLFLLEFYRLACRFVTNDIAAQAAFLAVLWPTSFELSLGDELSLIAYLVVLTLRAVLDNQWIITGIAVALTSLIDPMGICLLPLLILLFSYQQRHFPVGVVIKRILFGLVPVSAAFFWQGFSLWQNFWIQIFASMNSYWHGVQSFEWILAGQWAAFLMTLLGGLLFFFSRTALMFRFIPIYLLVALIFSTPVSAVGSRILLAAPNFIGIAQATSDRLSPFLKLLLLVLGAFEAFRTFLVV